MDLRDRSCSWVLTEEFEWLKLEKPSGSCTDKQTFQSKSLNSLIAQSANVCE
jgi:hypothetical protein